MNFADRLVSAIQKKGTPVCVGLDPRLAQIPKFLQDQAIQAHGKTLKGVAECFLEFGKVIIDAVADLVPVVKVQRAFYGQYGYEGGWAFTETIRYAKSKGLLTIADAKRNDIGSTVQAYADGYLGMVDVFGEKQLGFDADSMTANPYLGSDGIMPYIENCRQYNKGIFVLVKTSNPSSGELQDLIIEEDHLPVYVRVAKLVDQWGKSLIGSSGFSSVGAVVAATYPEEAQRLREVMPHTLFLVPGFGAQGGKAEDVRMCFDNNGMGAIVNSSRDIIFAYQKDSRFTPEQYGEAAREATVKMIGELKAVL